MPSPMMEPPNSASPAVILLSEGLTQPSLVPASAGGPSYSDVCQSLPEVIVRTFHSNARQFPSLRARQLSNISPPTPTASERVAQRHALTIVGHQDYDGIRNGR